MNVNIKDVTCVRAFNNDGTILIFNDLTRKKLYILRTFSENTENTFYILGFISDNILFRIFFTVLLARIYVKRLQRIITSKKEKNTCSYGTYSLARNFL